MKDSQGKAIHAKNIKKVYSDLGIELKNKFKGKSDADLRRIIRTKKGNTDDEGYELGRRKAVPKSSGKPLTASMRNTIEMLKKAGYKE